jgi:hypothetical protein
MHAQSKACPIYEQSLGSVGETLVQETRIESKEMSDMPKLPHNVKIIVDLGRNKF